MEEKIKGLTSEEVIKLTNEGKVNKQAAVSSRSYLQIIAFNVFTYLNLIIFSLAFILILLESYFNTLFVFTSVFNTLIGIIGEIRIKWALDKLKVITDEKATVMRNGKEEVISVDDVVLGDVLYLKEGTQICADSIILKSSHLVLNESLITGEEDPLDKKQNDKVLSGSFVVSGFGYAKTINIGEGNYATRLVIETKKYKKIKSELLNSLNKILKVLGIIIVPLGLLLFYSTYNQGGVNISSSIISSIGGVVGMIPQGLLVLSNVSFALGIVKMAKYNAYLKSLPSIETFSNITCLCLDKTGTLTIGDPTVKDIIIVANSKTSDVKNIVSNLNNVLPNTNATSIALEKHFGKLDSLKAVKVLPFSSDKKISGATFENNKTYILGAFEFMNINDKISKEKIDSYSNEGYRVITLASSNKSLSEKWEEDLKVEAIILMLDQIKSDAKEVLQYLKEEEVNIKIISGDNPITCAHIAKRCGLENIKYIDMREVKYDDYESIVENYNIFGRTDPHQKRQLIKIMKKKEKVAMVGDGVNDILALKEADFSIAMNSGSEAAKNVSEVLLLDSNFASLPHILKEGRKIVNNVNNVATLYLTKTIYSLILVIACIFLAISYPFQPIHISIISVTVIGFPSLLFIFLPNGEKPTESFLMRILRTAVPFGIVVVANVLLIEFLAHQFNFAQNIISTLSLITTEIIAMTLVYYVSKPINKIKRSFNIIVFSLFTIFMIIFAKVFEASWEFEFIYLIPVASAILSSLILIKTHKISL